MSPSDFTGRKPHSKPDDFVQDYITDVWGLTPVAKKQELSLKPVQQNAGRHSLNISVERHLSLVPTLKYDHGNSRMPCQTDLLILLFCHLYLLRRPLSPRVRQAILDVCAHIIEDFHAAFWLKQLSAKGAYSEV
jgi:hypothetical protein